MRVYRLSGEFNRTYPTREAANDALGILLERQELHSLDIKEVEIDECEIDTSDGVTFWRRLLSNLPSNRTCYTTEKGIRTRHKSNSAIDTR
jgi:hypothetical protein